MNSPYTKHFLILLGGCKSSEKTNLYVQLYNKVIAFWSLLLLPLKMVLSAPQGSSKHDEQGPPLGPDQITADPQGCPQCLLYCTCFQQAWSLVL